MKKSKRYELYNNFYIVEKGKLEKNNVGMMKIHTQEKGKHLYELEIKSNLSNESKVLVFFHEIVHLIKMMRVRKNKEEAFADEIATIIVKAFLSYPPLLQGLLELLQNEKKDGKKEN